MGFVPTASALPDEITLTTTAGGLLQIKNGGVDTAQLAAGAVTNTEVDAAAAIALSKLAAGSSAKIIVCDVNGVPTYVTQSGDVTNDNAGASTIANLAVTAAKIAANTITLAKMARVGNSGDFLRSTGASTDMAFSAFSSALSLVSTQSVTNVATITFSSLTGRRYIMFVELDCADSGRTVTLVLNNVTGAGTNAWQWIQGAGSTASASSNNSTTSIQVLNSTPGAATIAGVIDLMCAVTGSSSYPSCKFAMNQGASSYVAGTGQITTAATTFSQLDVKINSGDMTGLVSLYALT